MADFSITINDAIDVLGGEPPNYWGAMVWGTDGWAVGQPEIQSVDKVLPANSISAAEDTTYEATNTFSDSVAMASDITILTLVDSTGAYHVFQGDKTDAEDRFSNSWSTVAGSSSSWSQVSNPSTTWSEA